MRLCQKSNIAVELLKPAGPSGGGHGAEWAPGLNWGDFLQNEEVKMFLTHLAVEGQVSPSTQNQARAVLERMDGVEALVAGLQYGSGLRLLEALRLQVKDMELAVGVSPTSALAQCRNVCKDLALEATQNPW
jgi:hypothetical protein